MRLRPLTLVIPKPLLPVAETTMLSIIIRQLIGFNVSPIVISLSYMERFVRTFVQSLEEAGDVHFAHEEQPLGTAGSLTLVGRELEPIIVFNCDILTDLNIATLLAWHNDKNSELTIVSVKHEVTLPYGNLVTDDDNRLLRWTEPDQLCRRVSGGIYVVNRSVVDLILSDEHIDMPQLVCRAIEASKRVYTFEHSGVWFDVSDFTQYEQAAGLFETEPARFFAS